MRLSNRQPDACRRNPATLTPNGLRQAHSAADGLAASDAGCGGARLARSGPGGRRAEEERRREVIDGPLIETRRYHSCIHHQVPRMATSCVVFLDKLLSVSLPQLEGSGAAPQRSALSLRLRVGPCRHHRETKECSGKTRDQVIHEQVSMDSGTLGRQSGRGKTKGGHGCSTTPQKVPVLDKSRYYPPRKAKSLEGNAKSLSLKEALELFRPDFISRSRGRVKMLEQRARRRRALQGSDPDLLRGHAEGGGGQKRNCTTPDPLSDNLFKPRERSISGREMQLRSRRIYNKLPEVTKKKKEEKKRAESQTNRLRAEVFKKKLLDQILQR